MGRHYLMCWEENDEKHWNMIKEKDFDSFGLNLLDDPNVNNHTIFIIPCSGFIEGIWLSRHTHKSGRVDFWNFYEDYGTPYVPPVVKEENKDTLQTLHERNYDGTKYGWISPDGKYFHCGYQGHVALAEKICFGMIDTNNAERYLEEHGWCKIYKPLWENKYKVYTGAKHVITNAQMKTLIDLELDHAEGLSEILCRG